ncbi:hypothetical protein MYP_3909 [Sporocytophaga myxococcoides]|uniref:Outer membrane protein beta-barrel domain-containing protein n=1 Tax=Sporocytophaga myxococcoides TaxID=153721 RepID=A0A098LJL4_9BACT|nr:hypothetical protein [Sporocytophaga myxococcoides]GAL86679.1 hypothetical protein MYP_3909 [Sporocytophaga myxococcoides]
MNKSLIFSFLFLMSFHFSFGQLPGSKGFRIFTTPTQYIFKDYPITFEKIHNRHTFGITGSFRSSTKSGGEARATGSGMFGGYSSDNMRNYLYNAYTIMLNSKFYPGKGRSFFVEGVLFYRRFWFDNKYVKFEDMGGKYSFEGTRTERQNQYGFRLQCGFTFYILKSRKTHPIFEIYAGMGPSYKETTYITENGMINEAYYDYKKEFRTSWSPIFNAGVKVGFEYLKNGL